MGIPQGLQKIRDVTINRRGNHPRLERKPPLKRIADPANLESTDPAIKAAAEIKQAEDMKAQKIKAIKFLAKMGCGCYDKEGKITDALIAAMDDCTPDVRLAAIEAIGDTAGGAECCTKCGSTSCCSEKVTKRLSEIAYERDDTGCHLEPNADIRKAAAKALCICCPNRATGPIEEDVPETPVTPVDPDPIKGEGESGTQGIEGEGTANEGTENEAAQPETNADEAPADEDGEVELLPEATGDAAASASDRPLGVEATTEIDNLTPFQSVKNETQEVEISNVKMIGGMAIQPVTIAPVAATDEPETETAVETTATAPTLPQPIALSLSDNSDAPADVAEAQTVSTPVALPIPETTEAPQQAFSPKPIQRKKVIADVISVDHRSGLVILRSGQAMRPGSSVTVYHQYLTGERLVAHLLIKSVNGSQATAMVTDAAQLSKIHSGDRAVCF